MAESFSHTVDTAVQNRQIAGGAALAVSKTGQTLISKAFGHTSVDDTARPFAMDTVFWIASSTKLIASIAALQCVERGLFGEKGADVVIGDVLDGWDEVDILERFDGDTPVTRRAKEKITLRRLLTHSSGMVFSGMHPKVARWRDVVKGGKGDPGDVETLRNPVVFEPGSSWAYGVGIDWAGQMVEKVSGLTLGEYMRRNVFEVLGMGSTTFRPKRDEGLMARMAGQVQRNEKGELIPESSGMYPVRDYKNDLGGGGLYSCAEDYIKVLKSLLVNDGKLLKSDGEMYQELFRGQLEHPEALTDLVQNTPFGALVAPGYPRTAETQWNYALGGAVVEKEIPGHAAKGTLYWSGLPNNYWFIDRENGVCGFYASWLMPPGDAITGNMFAALQQAAVKEAGKEAAKL